MTQRKSRKSTRKHKFSSKKGLHKRKLLKKCSFGYQALQEFQVARNLYDLAATVNSGCSSR